MLLFSKGRTENTERDETKVADTSYYLVHIITSAHMKEKYHLMGPEWLLNETQYYIGEVTLVVACEKYPCLKKTKRGTSTDLYLLLHRRVCE